VRRASARRQVAWAVAAAVVVAVGLSGSAGAASGPVASAAPKACRRDPSACVRVGIGQPIYIGTLLDRTQLNGRDSSTAIDLAVDYLDGQFNGVDGTLLGHRVVLLDQEDGCSAATTRVSQQQLLSEPGLVAVIGTTCSSAALGVADAAFSEKHIPLVSPANTAPGLTDPAKHQSYYFRTSWNDKIQAAVDANFAASRKWSQLTVVSNPDDSYSSQLGQAFVDAARRNQGRGTVVDGPKGADPQAVAAAVAATDPEMIYLTILPPLCIDVARVLRSDPATANVPMLVSEGCADENFLEKLGPLSDGVYASGPDFSFYGENDFYRTAFLDAYRRRAGNDPPTAFHAQAFDAAQLVFDAIRRASSGKPGGELYIERRKLRTALLRTTNYPGLSGLLTCTEDGDCAQDVRIAIYEAPGWPTASQASPDKVFSQSLSLAQLRAAD
jgi:branched-chain amino acid transport system substrate-binding protein